jgi:hypothetical protein
MCGAIAHVRFTPDSDRESVFPQKVMSALPPKKRTHAVQQRMSTKGQKRTWLFDHFVGPATPVTN